ncbi:MAG TPA: hypothetical protein DCZ12_04310 [Gammaproteobacteria bacterium]|nr:hypothetical protein [Gammaproteobacteria bacterium]
MIDALFIYGTLAPGQPNEDLLKPLAGHWEPGYVHGTLYPPGTPPIVAYPVIKLEPSGTLINGLIFTSAALRQHWQRLDHFEGEEYERVVTQARTTKGEPRTVYIYVLNETR